MIHLDKPEAERAVRPPNCRIEWHRKNRFYIQCAIRSKYPSHWASLFNSTTETTLPHRTHCLAEDSFSASNNTTVLCGMPSATNQQSHVIPPTHERRNEETNEPLPFHPESTKTVTPLSWRPHRRRSGAPGGRRRRPSRTQSPANERRSPGDGLGTRPARDAVSCA